MEDPLGHTGPVTGSLYLLPLPLLLLLLLLLLLFTTDIKYKSEYFMNIPLKCK